MHGSQLDREEVNTMRALFVRELEEASKLDFSISLARAQNLELPSLIVPKSLSVNAMQAPVSC